MKIIENVLNKATQEQLKNFILSTFPWYYVNDVTFKDSGNYTPAFGHTFIEDGKAISEQANMLDLFRHVVKGNIVQARAFLQLPLNKKLISKKDPLHIDRDEPHTVFIYYLLDSDGDTIIYNERKESETYTIKQRVTPKQGRIVIFDGGLYHTAEQPLNNTRCIVNLSLIHI